METKRRVISWFSCGAASAVATKIALKSFGHAVTVPVYCATNAEHPDNKRFMERCEEWFGTPIDTVASSEYRDTWHVWEKKRYMAGIKGAPCTAALKVEPRLEYQKPDDIHVFGYTADGPDAARAQRLRDNYPELTIVTPLIEAGLTKQSCLAILQDAGIELPVMYGLGFYNNNCIPCVKATSASYWALIRKEFPDQFERAAKLSRELGARLCRIDGERAFIDEIPLDHPTNDPIAPACDFLCHIIEQEMEIA